MFHFYLLLLPHPGMTMSEWRNKLGKSFINYIVSTIHDANADYDYEHMMVVAHRKINS